MRSSKTASTSAQPESGAVCCHRELPSRRGASPINSLTEIVDALCDRTRNNCRPFFRGQGLAALPSRDIIAGIIEDLRSVLFPGYFGVSEVSDESMRFHVGSTLDQISYVLLEQIRRGLCFTCAGDTPERCGECEMQAQRSVQMFLSQLPEVQKILATDVQAAFEGDPAATNSDEAIFCYPGILAITNYRLAHELAKLEVPLIPRIIAEHAHSLTGIDIHPGAEIGDSFFIDHGTGVVIGETAVIGKKVRVYQGVTLGARSFPLDENGRPVKGIPRHPIVEDSVVIYSGATILGRVTIGRNSVIGGNVWLTRSVSPNTHITQAQVRQDQFEEGGGI